METGKKGTKKIIVTKEMTAEAMGSGNLPVYATPSMIALMEQTACDSVRDELEEGMGTVGTFIQVKHLSATPIGCEVVCETTLVEIDRKRFVFEVKAFDEMGLIGEGTHERFLIDNQKFMEKAQGKLSASDSEEKR